MTVEAVVKIGGLMRCCVATLEAAMVKANVPPKEGDVLSCRYKCGNRMIFRDGMWEWDGAKPRLDDPYDIFEIIRMQPTRHDHRKGKGNG